MTAPAEIQLKEYLHVVSNSLPRVRFQDSWQEPRTPISGPWSLAKSQPVTLDNGHQKLNRIEARFLRAVQWCSGFVYFNFCPPPPPPPPTTHTHTTHAGPHTPSSPTTQSKQQFQSSNLSAINEPEPEIFPPSPASISARSIVSAAGLNRKPRKPAAWISARATAECPGQRGRGGKGFSELGWAGFVFFQGMKRRPVEVGGFCTGFAAEWLARRTCNMSTGWIW